MGYGLGAYLGCNSAVSVKHDLLLLIRTASKVKKRPKSESRSLSLTGTLEPYCPDYFEEVCCFPLSVYQFSTKPHTPRTLGPNRA